MSRMPQVQARELIAFLKKRGFVEDRDSGGYCHSDTLVW